MTAPIILSEHERTVVCAILRRNLAAPFRVFVFGSRAGGTVKPWSDLDLSIEGPGPLPLSTLATLREEFDESSLPWKVDLVDRFTTSDEFGSIIDRHKLELDYTEN